MGKNINTNLQQSLVLKTHCFVELSVISSIATVRQPKISDIYSTIKKLLSTDLQIIKIEILRFVFSEILGCTTIGYFRAWIVDANFTD